MRKLLLAFLLSLSLTTKAQLTENFTDADITNNPTWFGNIDQFLVNSSFQLQSNDTIANSSFYISTPQMLATSAQWEMYIKLDLATSSLNYVDVYLISSDSALLSGANTGYFVRLGGTDDEISLYRKDAGGVVLLIDGADGVINHTSNNTIRLKVVRDTNNQWNLLRDMSGGNSFVSEGVATDAAYLSSSYFGILVKQSTPSFFKKHYFDDIIIQNYVPDVTPPTLISANATSATTLDVLFDESVDATTAEQVANYVADNGIGAPGSAMRDAANTALVHLVFANAFPTGSLNTLTATGITDVSGNVMVSGATTFTYTPPYAAQRYDVIMDEIMPDPTPTRGMPEAEYVELKNRTANTINLQGWRISSLSTTSAPFPAYSLQPGAYVIITSTGDASLFTSFGSVLGITTFPALLNDGTTLSLTANNGATIHSISYDASWYHSVIKSDGGYSLEMIDDAVPCAGIDNWRASDNASGGTPDATNSVHASNPDQEPPALIRAAVVDSVTVVLTFSETIDSVQGSNTANYSLTNGINIATVSMIAPAFNKAYIILASSLMPQTVYSISVNNISDCSGNIIQSMNTARFGLPAKMDALDMVINEVLFDAKTGSSSYIELYNRSQKILNLKNAYLSAGSNTMSVRQLSSEDLLIFPGEYYVITDDAEDVKRNYYTQYPNNFVIVPSLSLDDNKGYVVIRSIDAPVIDSLHYNSKWHFALIDNADGVALERVDYDKPTNDSLNWTSAASTVGYGTPTYRNSQYKVNNTVAADIAIIPKVFSPDNDGYDDYATINYNLAETGYVANVTIFDASGRPVRTLVKNATLSQSGLFRWDGLDDKLNKLPIGIYVVYTQIYNLQGKTRAFKNTVTLARRLK